jgi:lysophospholipase L1-like esterase
MSALPPDADLVIAQAGGNDIGFATLAGACFLAGTSTCLTTVREGHRRIPEVRRGILGLVRQIRLTAPTAEVIVLGYPRLLGSPARCRSLLEADRVRAVDRLQRTLDRVIRSAARTGGATFTDWPRSIDRASLCSADPWYAMPGERLDDLLHPNERANRVLFRHLDSVIGR